MITLYPEFTYRPTGDPQDEEDCSIPADEINRLVNTIEADGHDVRVSDHMGSNMYETTAGYEAEYMANMLREDSDA